VQFRANSSANANENRRPVSLEIAVPASTPTEISQKSEPDTLTIIKNSSNRTAVMASTSALDLRRSCRWAINRFFQQSEPKTISYTELCNHTAVTFKSGDILGSRCHQD